MEEKNSSDNEETVHAISDELALIQRQMKDLSSHVQNKDIEISEMRGNIRSEKSTFLYINQKLEELEGKLNVVQNQKKLPPRRGEKRSLVGDIVADIEKEVDEENFESDDDLPDDMSESDLAMIPFDEDTFSLMMLNPIVSRAWLIAVLSYLFQWITLVLIFVNLLSTSAKSSPLNIPYSVPLGVTVGQFLGIFICVGVQTDILSAIRILAAFSAEKDWAELLGIEGGGTKMDFSLRVLLPNCLKFASGCMVLAVNFVTIVQSSNIVNLMKDVAALLIISEISQICFKLAEFGFLGQKFEDLAKVVAETEVRDPFTKEGLRMNYRLLTFSALVISMSAAVGYFLVGQQNGSFFYQIYPNCEISKSEIPLFNNGVCDGGFLNTIACAFDGGDCVNYNLAYPNCEAVVPSMIGDGNCDQQYNTPECNFDGADCCPYIIKEGETEIRDPRLKDGMCDGGQFSTKKCQYDEGDCSSFQIDFPFCNLNELGDLVGENVPRLGDGLCESAIYNNAECGFENGDCNLCNSKVHELSLTGDGVCHGGYHNSQDCNWDAGDCTEFNNNYPRCHIEAEPKLQINGTSVPIIGDGVCNSGMYNTADCGYEDGDCLLCNELIDNITKIGDGQCDGQNYMSEACGFDGGDCLGCTAPRYEIGNGWCTLEYNTKECGYDGGDCDILKVYPDCEAPAPSLLANGHCNGGIYNTEACGFDGDDCLDTKYLTLQSCNVDQPDLLGDGICQGGPYNTVECDWDGGDCTEFNDVYPNCTVPFPQLIGNGWCSGGIYDVESCGWDGGDCML